MTASSAQIVLIALAALLACGTPKNGAVTLPPPPQPAEPAPANAVPVGSSVPGLRGWLGVRAGGGDASWTGITGTSTLVVVEPERVTGLQPGAPVEVLTTTGVQRLQFRGPETGRFGCDGGAPVRVAAFDGAVSDDLVWIVPPVEGVARAWPVEVTDTADTRQWRFGGRTLGVSRTGTYQAVLWEGDERSVLRAIDLRKQVMGGYEPEPIDLTSAFFVPQIAGAWTLDGVDFAAATWSSFETVHFTVFVLGSAIEEIEVGSLYQCAF